MRNVLRDLRREKSDKSSIRGFVEDAMEGRAGRAGGAGRSGAGTALTGHAKGLADPH